MKRALVLVAVIAIVGAWVGAAQAAGPLTLEGSVSLNTPARDLVLDDAGQIAYVATDQGLAVVDISNRQNPVKLASLALGGKSYGIARKGSLVFVANVTTGLRVVDVSNPANPLVVATKTIPYKAWDVAVKDDAVYAVSYAGEMYVLQWAWASPTAVTLTQKKVIGLLAWSSAAHDAVQLAKLNNHVTSGNAKVTGVTVKGDVLITLDFAYGRIFYYNVANPLNPIFAGTHYAPFMFRVDMFHPDDDPEQTVVYALAASGGVSGVYSLPISILDPSISTRYTTCAVCGYFKTPVTDFGGLTVSENGRYVVYLAGKQGVIQVLDASDPSTIVPAPNGLLPITGHASKLAEPMGAQTFDEYIIAAVGGLGLRIYRYLGLDAP
jgi:hypothetical protein